jgi:hypothetical protein
MAAANGANGAPGAAQWTMGPIVDQFGKPIVAPSGYDSAFVPIEDPTKDVNALRARVLVISREIPNVIVQTGWTVSDVRSTVVDLVAGIFDRPAQLQDALAADSRMQSAMRSRSGGLLGRPLAFKLPRGLEKDPIARKCLRVWEKHWPQMHAEPALLDLLETSHSLGFAYTQTLWDTQSKYWLPYLQSFNARYSWYNWEPRQHMAITRDGSVPITAGDGHWVLHAPYGAYRGWMRGHLRAVAQWWLARNYALRDWARYSERHGYPIILADAPFGADPGDIAAFTAALTAIGQESVLQLAGSVDVSKYGKYDLRYLEPKDRNWQAFKDLIQQCNDEITLALLGQNLTSEVKEGSFAAARVHADVRQAILEADARALARTIYTQILRPFAALNFGDAKYAPTCQWDVRPVEDLKTKAEAFEAYATAMNQLRQAGKELDNPEGFARQFGLRGMKVHDVDPVQVEAKLAQATGVADDKPNAIDPMTDALATMARMVAKTPAKNRAKAIAAYEKLVVAFTGFAQESRIYEIKQSA